jgi:hypothetical protein
LFSLRLSWQNFRTIVINLKVRPVVVQQGSYVVQIVDYRDGYIAGREFPGEVL